MCDQEPALVAETYQEVKDLLSEWHEVKELVIIIYHYWLGLSVEQNVT